MKGQWKHNIMLVARVTDEAGPHATVRHEVPVSPGQRQPSADSVVDWPHLRAVVEGEVTPPRVPNDVAKAVRLGAGALVLVAPTRRVVRGIRQKLALFQLKTLPFQIFVFTQGEARQWVANQAQLARAATNKTNNQDPRNYS